MAAFGVQRIGRYEVLDHLASGGMGHVYLARATGPGGFERLAVIKTLDHLLTAGGVGIAGAGVHLPGQQAVGFEVG